MKILVVMGGISSEKEISLKSGENIYNKLKQIYPNTEKYILTELKEFYKHILENQYDFVFLVLHGKYGEDGVIQSFLESLKIPFSFSNSTPSLIAMNKMITNTLIEKFIESEKVFNLFLPKTVYIRKKEYEKYGLKKVFSQIKEKFLNPPLIVKPNLSGSSVGLSLIENSKDIEKKLKQALNLAFQEDDNLTIIQEYIEGREITVGVIQNKQEIIPLEPCELALQDSKLFDFENKYIKKIDHIIPPELPSETLDYLKYISAKIFEFFDFKDAVRIDYRLKEENGYFKVYFLEVNTIPGFTEVSLLPQEAEKTGIKFDKLLKIIVENNIYEKNFGSIN
ncbi:MAG: ATP-grasp domain-containing protein [bacterium]